MNRVNMTGFFTLCWKSNRTDALTPGHGLRRWVRWAVVCLWACVGAAQATHPGSVSELALQVADDGVDLHAVLDFDLPTLAEDALRKGIPMYFVTEVEITRGRWYWYDQKIAQAERYSRLSYQPLTRRWRLNIASEPFDPSGLGVALGQNFDSLPEVLAAMQRLVRWRVASKAAIEPHVAYNVQLRFRLDLSQLPRPLQIGALGRSGWNLSVARQQRWVWEPQQ